MIFNKDNTEWESGIHPIFLGQSPALYDSVNTNYPKLFELYKQQKAQDWAENEINLEQSRIDMISCPNEIRDLMVKNLAYQWEADSVASRSIAPLFAPFVTNSEAWAALLKNSEIEVLHALTYSEIVRQCFEFPDEVFKEVMHNENVLSRLDKIASVFETLQINGARKILNVDAEEEFYSSAMMGMVALYLLERIQFMASFAATFAVVEQGWFQGIGKLVQKIMQDELYCHSAVDEEILKIEMNTKRGQHWFIEHKDEIKLLIDEVVKTEKSFANYLFSENRQVVGLNVSILSDWIDYCAAPVYKLFGFESVAGTAIPYMENWLDLNKFQIALQEGSGNNYLLNVIIDDFNDSIIYD